MTITFINDITKVDLQSQNFEVWGEVQKNFAFTVTQNFNKNGINTEINRIFIFNPQGTEDYLQAIYSFKLKKLTNK